VIRSAEHLALADQAARAGIALLRQDAAVFPLRPDQHKIGLVEFASYLDSPAMDKGEQTGFVRAFQKRAPKTPIVSLKPDPTEETWQHAQQVAKQVEVLVLATRSAHLQPEQLQRAQELLKLARQVILVCLRNPYDVNELSGARTILCACGDSTPSLSAVVAALFGDFTPTGKLSVQVKLAV